MSEERKFNFKWKLIENYFNGFMVFSFTLLFTYAFVYKNDLYFAIAILWGLLCPFLATFIDKKSHQGKIK